MTIHLLVLLLFFKFHIDDFLEKWDKGTSLVSFSLASPASMVDSLLASVPKSRNTMARKVREFAREKAGSYGVTCSCAN